MVDIPDALLAAVAKGGAGVRVLQASFVGATSTGCQVDIQGNRVPATLATSFLPEVQEVVWLWALDDRFFIVGPAAVKPDRGTVQSTASGLVTLTTSIGTTITCPYAGAAPAAGQVMKLLWQGGPFAFLMSTSPAAAAPPPPPASTPVTHADTFNSVDAGSYGTRWFTNQVWGSDHNLGAWFYGTKISDTIPSSAVIQRVQVWVPPGSQISGSAPNFAVHSYLSKPAGAPALSTVAAVGISGGYVDLPVSVGTALKNGGGSFGVGLNHGGYNILLSRDQDAASGQLVITSTY
jgi:hypothetical protein